MSEEETFTSVPKAGVMEASKAMLQKQLYAVFTRPVGGLGAVMGCLEEHLQFQMQLEREGVMFAAGPMWTDAEDLWEGEGMVIIRAASRAEAIAVAERDPMHISGARSFTVRPWMINEGSMTIRLDHSSQTYSIL